jgi:FAD binding domain-containing protein/berberine-like enzyme
MKDLPTRRQLLQRGAVAVSAGVAVSAVPTLLTVPAARAAATDPDWDGLEKSLTNADAGTLYRPTDASYGPLSTPQNHRYANIRPQGVVCPGNDAGLNGAEGVSIAITWAQAQGLPVSPYSNGHNYAGYSTTPGLLLNLTRLKNASFTDSTHTQLTIGTGATNGDVYPWLRANPDQSGAYVAIPTGRCPTVALGGLVLGGGIGFSDRMYGLTCDTLVQTTVVLASGEIVVANAGNQYSDLFWACRGGAGNNFGVHVDFTFATHPVPADDQFSVFDLRWAISDTNAVCDAFQALIADSATPDGFHLRFGIGTFGQTPQEVAANAGCNALGEFYGTADELTQLLTPVLNVATPTKKTIQAMSFWDATDYTFATTPVLQWGSKSAIVETPLTDQQIDACVQAITTWPGSRNSDGAGIALFAMGGAVNRVPADATAYVHRDALFIMALESSWADDDTADRAQKCSDWLDALYTAVWTSSGPDHCYQNFPDPELTDWAQRYYGTNYAQLQAVKDKYDPAGFFSYAQGVENG